MESTDGTMDGQADVNADLLIKLLRAGSADAEAQGDAATWVERLNNKLARARELLAEAGGLIDEALTQHIYDEHEGPDEDCGYTACAKEIENFLAEVPAPPPERIRIGVTLEGGVVQGVFSDKPHPEVEVIVIDYDTEDADYDDLEEVQQRRPSDGEPTVWIDAYVTRHEVAVDPKRDFDADFREMTGDE